MPGYSFTSTLQHEPQPGERWKNKHTGGIAVIVRIDDVQVREHPIEVRRVVVWTRPGSTEEQRHSLHEHQRAFVPRGLIALFGEEKVRRIDGWHEHWELAEEHDA